MKPAQDSIAEAVRVSHCAHETPGTHKCVGVCEITPSGCNLKCELCGEGSTGIRYDKNYLKLQKILTQIGIDIDHISLDRVTHMLAELAKS